MSRALPLAAPTPRPTVRQAFSIFQQLTASQRKKLLQKQLQVLDAEVEAAAQRVHRRMEAAGVTITDEEIQAEVKAVRAMNRRELLQLLAATGVAATLPNSPSPAGAAGHSAGDAELNRLVRLYQKAQGWKHEALEDEDFASATRYRSQELLLQQQIAEWHTGKQTGKLA